MVTRHGTEEDDVAGMFLSEAFRLEADLYDKRPNYPIHMSEEQIKQHKAATICYLCRKPFSDSEPSLSKCADHDHNLEINSYVGSAHNKCNAAKKREATLTFWAHNAQRYDMHCVFRALISHPMLVGKSIDVLPTTHDSYKSATIHINRKLRRSIRFLDSFNFISASLDTISTSLSPKDLFLMNQIYPMKSQRDLLLRKGVYCYEHVQSHAQLLDEKELPPIEQFYSSLSGSTVSQEDYERAQAVWKGLQCKTLLDYTLHYLKTDVILLASFMDRFRSMIYRKYGLEVNWFVSASSLSMCCMYKFTGAVVERVSDPQMHAQITAGVRGGYAGVHRRYAEANVPGTPTFKPEDPEKHILLFDVNALYSHMMQKPLPVGDYTWMSQQELDAIKWDELKESDEHMCIVTVDLSIPRHLHSRLDEFPPAVEKCRVPEDWYSDAQRDMIRDCALTTPQLSEEKLVAHLHPKRNYLVHGLVLAAYIKMGVRVDAIKSGIRFRQAPYLKSYIQDLMEERQNAVYKFQQDVWKVSITC